ncbi:unnamed protein product [Closterium sp. NIES-54]
MTMTKTSGSCRPCMRTPSPERACHPIGAFADNNPFTTRHNFNDDDDQDWNLPIPLLQSPPHIPDTRAAPIDWISREQILNFDTPHIVTPRLALLARDDNKHYNTWYLDSCCGQHMVGSERFVSNAVATPTVTYVTVANNTCLRANAQGIIMLKARGSLTHITLNYVLIVQNLRFNLLLAAQLMDCEVELSTDLRTRDILLHCTAPKKARRQIGRAHSENGVYILDFDIPDYSGDSKEFIDLVPLRFEHIHHSDWKHPNGRPWKRKAPPMKGGGEPPADGERVTLADGAPQLAATPTAPGQVRAADGAPHLAAEAVGVPPAKAGELPAKTKGGKK